MDVFAAKAYLTEEEIGSIREQVEREIQEACKFASESPYPDAGELMEDIFCE